MDHDEFFTRLDEVAALDHRDQTDSFQDELNPDDQADLRFALALVSVGATWRRSTPPADFMPETAVTNVADVAEQRTNSERASPARYANHLVLKQTVSIALVVLAVFVASRLRAGPSRGPSHSNRNATTPGAEDRDHVERPGFALETPNPSEVGGSDHPTPSPSVAVVPVGADGATAGATEPPEPQTNGAIETAAEAIEVALREVDPRASPYSPVARLVTGRDVGRWEHDCLGWRFDRPTWIVGFRVEAAPWQPFPREGETPEPTPAARAVFVIVDANDGWPRSFGDLHDYLTYQSIVELPSKELPIRYETDLPPIRGGAGHGIDPVEAIATGRAWGTAEVACRKEEGFEPHALYNSRDAYDRAIDLAPSGIEPADSVVRLTSRFAAASWSFRAPPSAGKTGKLAKPAWIVGFLTRDLANCDNATLDAACADKTRAVGPYYILSANDGMVIEIGSLNKESWAELQSIDDEPLVITFQTPALLPTSASVATSWHPGPQIVTTMPAPTP